MHLRVLSEYMSGSEMRNQVMSGSERINQVKDTASFIRKEVREREHNLVRGREAVRWKRDSVVRLNNHLRK